MPYERFPEPIITPTTKADEGHDMNISKEEIIAQGIKGLPPQKFFATHSMLEDATGKTVDLVDFDEKPQFSDLLSDLGELHKIG